VVSESKLSQLNDSIVDLINDDSHDRRLQHKNFIEICLPHIRINIHTRASQYLYFVWYPLTLQFLVSSSDYAIGFVLYSYFMVDQQAMSLLFIIKFSFNQNNSMTCPYQVYK